MKRTISKLLGALLLIGWGANAANAQALAQRPEVRRSELTCSFGETKRRAAGGTLRFEVPLFKPEPFLAVGVTWRSADADGDKLRLHLRTSLDGTTWSAWFALPINHDGETDGDVFASALALLDARTLVIECRLDSNLPGAVLPAFNELKFHFISPGATPPGLQEQIQRKAMSQAQPTPNYPKPPIVTRTEWGCPDGQVTTHGTLSYTTVTHLIVHHTATGNAAANHDWAAVVRSIWNFHVFTNGWADVGYNYLIDPDGVIYEGRAGGDNVQGAHFSGVNAGTMGVSMIGTFTEVVPAETQMTSLRRLLAWKSSQRGIDPMGKARHAASGLELNNISGHRDGPGATECPGNALYPLLPSLRESVKALLSANSAVACVSAASFTGEVLASEAIVAAFGTELAAVTQAATGLPLPTNLGGTTVVIRDSAGVERFAPLFFVAPGQVNYQLPAGTRPGPAAVLITNATGRLASGMIQVETVAPALFAANANGRGVPAAVLLRVKADGTQVYEPVTVRQGEQFIEAPIDLDDETEQVFLIAYGTGWRNRSSLAAVAARVSDLDVPVLFAGAVEGLAGLDQLNVRLPHALKGRGLVDFAVTMEGKASNLLRIRIK
jgi:uncharacterized protein (TIGR03437 family)